jgi:hypothetical protein
MPHMYHLGSLVIGPMSTPADHVAARRASVDGGIAGLCARLESSLAMSLDLHVRISIVHATLRDAEYVAQAYREAGWEAFCVSDSKWGSYLEVCAPSQISSPKESAMSDACLVQDEEDTEQPCPHGD